MAIHSTITRLAMGLVWGVASVMILTGCEFLGALPGSPNGELPMGTLVLRKTGGIAGVNETITIELQDETIVKTVRAGLQDIREGKVTRSDWEELWQILSANDAFALPDHTELMDHLADGFRYELTLQVGSRQHAFTVYAPDVLRHDMGEVRYGRIVEAIEALPMQAPYTVFDLQVDDVTFNILESFPAQAVTVIEGTLPTPCTELHEVTQIRDGDTIRVHVTMKQSIDVACIQVTKPFEVSVKLDGVFPPGRYRVIVNGNEYSFSA